MALGNLRECPGDKLKSGWWSDSLRGLVQRDKFGLVLVEGQDEFHQVLMAPEAAEALLGHQQRRRAPAQHHPGVAPAFDPARPRFGAGITAFDQVGGTQTVAQPFVDAQPVQGERFFQAFRQTARGAGG